MFKTNKFAVPSIIFASIVTANVYAFPCLLTVVKDSCWTKYDVTVTGVNVMTNKTEISVLIPRGKSWARGSFSCDPSETLTFNASFKPAFWKGDVDKQYPSMSKKSLPTVITKDETAWSITLAYPGDFSSITLPPDASGNCKYDLKAVPAVEPQ